MKKEIIEILEAAERAESGYTYEEQKKNGHVDSFGVSNHTWIRMKNKILKLLVEGKGPTTNIDIECPACQYVIDEKIKDELAAIYAEKLKDHRKHISQLEGDLRYLKNKLKKLHSEKLPEDLKRRLLNMLNNVTSFVDGERETWVKKDDAISVIESGLLPMERGERYA